MSHNFFLITILFLVAMPVKGQNKLGYLAPWEVLGISPHYISQTKDVWDEAWHGIHEKHFSNQGKPLHEMIKDKPITMNQIAYARQFMAAESSASYLMQPIVCQLGKVGYIANASIDTQSGIIVRIDINEFSYEDLLVAQQNKLKEQVLSAIDSWPSAMTDTAPTRSLKLMTTIKRESLGLHHGELLCANLILQKSLAKQYRVINTIGQKNLLFVRSFESSPALQRSNRAIHMDWQKQDQSWQLSWGSSEGILGTSLQRQKTWKINPITADFKIPKELLELLKQENLSLEQSTPPRVVKIYGAWAYLDKGRAWGLKMNDRLVTSKNNETYKGHIVGFYGPRKNLASRSGLPVHDGAILYIRKGQHRIKIGDPFDFDKATYPSAWPPKN